MTHASAGEWYAAVEWMYANGNVWWKIGVAIEKELDSDEQASGDEFKYFSTTLGYARAVAVANDICYITGVITKAVLSLPFVEAFRRMVLVVSTP